MKNTHMEGATHIEAWALGRKVDVPSSKLWVRLVISKLTCDGSFFLEKSSGLFAVVGGRGVLVSVAWRCVVSRLRVHLPFFFLRFHCFHHSSMLRYFFDFLKIVVLCLARNFFFGV